MTYKTILSAAVLLCGSATALGAPKAELWPRWEAHDAASTAEVSHASWDELLAGYLTLGSDQVARFAYGRVSAADRQQLGDYLASLAGTPVSTLAKDEQLAYWINMYNALTVEVILANYPVASIKDISPSLFGGGPWDDELITVEGETLTLNDIEHRILRPIWQDARLHYAVNCASIGCPNLAAKAYTAANAEQQLELGAKLYVNHPRGAQVSDGQLQVSSIYEWFKEDFGGSDAGVIAHLRQYADAGLQQRLAGISSIAGDGYDWNLNESD